MIFSLLFTAGCCKPNDAACYRVWWYLAPDPNHPGQWCHIEPANFGEWITGIHTGPLKCSPCRDCEQYKQNE